MRQLFSTVVLATLASCATAHEAGAVSSKPLIAAHRGGAMHRPENTMSAFRHAVELGVDVLEFDMVMTADDQLVVHHDASVNPKLCTPDAGSSVVAGPVRTLTYAQTQQFDCGSLVRDIYTKPGHVAQPGARIPKVAEVLGEFSDAKVVFFAETKVPKPVPGVPDVDPMKFARLIDELVRKHAVVDRFVLQSSDYRTIDALHEINPRIRTCLLGAHNWGHRRFLETVRQHHASCILLRDTNAAKDDVQQLQKAGVQVYSEVIDQPEQWQTYLDLGVDVLFTNAPADLMDFLRKNGAQP